MYTSHYQPMNSVSILWHSAENRKFWMPNLLFPGLLLGGLYMSISKLYSGFLQVSTFCLGPSSEIFFLQKCASFNPRCSQSVCKRAFSYAFAPGDSLWVLLQEKAKDEKQGCGERSPLSFHTKNWSGKHTICSVLREIPWRLGDRLTFP